MILDLLTFFGVAGAVLASVVCFMFLAGVHRSETWRQKHHLSLAGTALLCGSTLAVALTRIGWAVYRGLHSRGIVDSPPADMLLINSAVWVVFFVALNLFLYGAVAKMREQG